MNFKKILVWTSFLGIGFTFGTVIGIGVFNKPKALPKEPEKEVLALTVPTEAPMPLKVTPVPTPTPEKEKTSEFLLMLSGTSICLYELVPDGTTVMLQETEIDLAQLRKEDYENLCSGITVSNLEEAKVLCEDFGS